MQGIQHTCSLEIHTKLTEKSEKRHYLQYLGTDGRTILKQILRMLVGGVRTGFI
jgi:hypothetical protein